MNIRTVLLLLGLSTIPLWFYTFPIKKPFDWGDVFFEGLYLLTVTVGYIIITKLEIPVLEAGWALFVYGLLIDFLDEFTKEPELLNTYLEGMLTTSGLGLVAVGLYLSQKKLRRELEKTRQAREALRIKSEQQAAVAGIGELALSGARFRELVDEAVRLTAQALDVELCKILWLEDSGRSLKVIAGVGWKDGVVGTARVGVSSDSQAGYTLERRGPVVVKDLRREKRFSSPKLLKEHGIVSGISIPMMHGDKLYGVFGAHTRSYREFTESDVNFMESVANIVTAAIGRIEAEKELKRYAKELEQSNKLKELFTDIMRHDLQNPISIIKGMSELLKEEGISEEALEEVQIIERNAEKLLKMLDNAAELAKLESVKELKVEERDLRELMESAVTTYGSEIEEKGMRALFDMDGEFPAMVHPSMEDVFSNLVSNAVKYGRKKTEIRVGIQDAGEDWRVYVKDRGDGIRDEFKTEIFNRFKRKSKRGVRGIGLGLAIVKRIVDLHNGRVWVEDNPGGGSVFYVQIPKNRKTSLHD